ncbi:hypothetical protein [Sphingosinicella sp.]|uniref:hypothetical protein n=1 Tax=Sphingosinicella sp. TaxID=1917971 RepID=UPI004037FF1F
MRKAVLMALAALASVGAAQPPYESAPAPSLARWDFQTVAGQRYLRATANEGDGPGKLMFLCNDRRELVVMAMIAHDDPAVLTGAGGSSAWIIDAALARDAAPPGSQPVVMNQAVMSIIGLDGAAYRRIFAARAFGIAWLDVSGAARADFQIGMAEGREPLAAFARECNAQTYP